MWKISHFHLRSPISNISVTINELLILVVKKLWITFSHKSLLQTPFALQQFYNSHSKHMNHEHNRNQYSSPQIGRRTNIGHEKCTNPQLFLRNISLLVRSVWNIRFKRPETTEAKPTGSHFAGANFRNYVHSFIMIVIPTLGLAVDVILSGIQNEQDLPRLTTRRNTYCAPLAVFGRSISLQKTTRHEDSFVPQLHEK